MADPFLGEIRLFGGNFAPVGWALCQGQLLNVSEYDTLFALVGTTYGGDGQSTFALPDLRGRVPLHQSSSYPIGQSAGVETVTLVEAEVAKHNHPMVASQEEATGDNPAETFLAKIADGTSGYGSGSAVSYATGRLTKVGGNQPHENMQPFLGLNFIIALVGIFPSQG